jgi:hypothetical protein
MKKEQETKDSHNCEHCGRGFIRESTLIKHLCEQKRRWLDKDKTSNRVGYSSWKNYYNKHHPSKKNTEYTDFIKSSYYTAFVKFGSYCVDAGVINPTEYIKYLISNHVSIDNWASDRYYGRYLIEYLRSEDPYDAVKRSATVLSDISQTENLKIGDVLRYANANKVCYLITTGKISPWMLYNSKSGVEFLSKLTQDQTNIVFEYIDPEKWNIKFKRDQQIISDIKYILQDLDL